MTNFQEIPGCLHDDPLISTDDKSRIRVLAEAEAISQWEAYVSPTERHFKLLGDSEWPSKIVADTSVFYFWQDDWNNNEYSTLGSKLTALDINPQGTVYVFWMREICATTNWCTFVANWGNFLYEDEGCIIVPEDNSKSLIFSNGKLWVGHRAPI